MRAIPIGDGYLYLPSMNDSVTWSTVAAVWEQLFPLRQPRVDMCASLLPPQGALLDAGCGTGALVRALLPMGVDAFGFDLDAGFVAQARLHLATDSDRVVAADLVAIESVFPGKVFDCIVCLGQTFPHLLTDSDIHAFLSGAAGRLHRGGRLVLQVVSDRDETPDRTLPDLQAAGVGLRRRRILTSPDRAVLHLVATRATGSSSWSVEHRRWTPESLAAAASAFGLVPEAVWADESKKPWTGTEAGWILVLSKE